MTKKRGKARLNELAKIQRSATSIMAEKQPPPYFPQSQLSPPDPNRYRRFKAIVVLVILLVVGVIGGLGAGVYYLIKRLAG